MVGQDKRREPISRVESDEYSHRVSSAIELTRSRGSRMISRPRLSETAGMPAKGKVGATAPFLLTKPGSLLGGLQPVEQPTAKNSAERRCDEIGSRHQAPSVAVADLVPEQIRADGYHPGVNPASPMQDGSRAETARNGGEPHDIAPWTIYDANGDRSDRFHRSMITPFRRRNGCDIL